MKIIEIRCFDGKIVDVLEGKFDAEWHEVIPPETTLDYYIKSTFPDRIPHVKIVRKSNEFFDLSGTKIGVLYSE
jgi:hypothetical protein